MKDLLYFQLKRVFNIKLQALAKSWCRSRQSLWGWDTW